MGDGGWGGGEGGGLSHRQAWARRRRYIASALLARKARTGILFLKVSTRLRYIFSELSTGPPRIQILSTLRTLYMVVRASGLSGEGLERAAPKTDTGATWTRHVWGNYIHPKGGVLN